MKTPVLSFAFLLLVVGFVTPITSVTAAEENPFLENPSTTEVVEETPELSESLENIESENNTVKTEDSSEALQVVSASAVGKNNVIVIFNKLLDEETLGGSFLIEDEEAVELEVISEELMEDGISVKLTTADQVALKLYTLTAFSSLSDTEGGAVISGKMDNTEFLGGEGEYEQEVEEEEVHEAAAPEDTTPPEDVSSLRANYKLRNAAENSYTVDLDWTASVDSAGDLEYQNYRQKTDGVSYSTAIRIEKDKTSYQKVLEGGERYTFKISTVDDSGNESFGAITSIILPETGPAALLGLMGMFSAGAAHMVRRRKK